MPPTNEVGARAWAGEAMKTGGYRFLDTHFDDRCKERGFDLPDVHAAIQRCRSVEPHTDPPKRGGTCWRFWGRNVDGDREFAVGLETYVENGVAKVILLCTVIEARRTIR